MKDIDKLLSDELSRIEAVSQYQLQISLDLLERELVDMSSEMDVVLVNTATLDAIDEIRQIHIARRKLSDNKDSLNLLEDTVIRWTEEVKRTSIDYPFGADVHGMFEQATNTIQHAIRLNVADELLATIKES